MQLIFHSKVTKLGDLVSAFIEEKMLILFKDNAPEELADYCVLHSGNELNGEVRENDICKIGSAEYRVVFVGSEVQKNLRDLGHITLRFNANCEGESLEGSLYLEDKEIVPVQVGDTISIVRN